jgi:hypothetical protein
MGLVFYQAGWKVCPIEEAEVETWKNSFFHFLSTQFSARFPGLFVLFIMQQWMNGKRSESTAKARCFIKSITSATDKQLKDSFCKVESAGESRCQFSKGVTPWTNGMTKIMKPLPGEVYPGWFVSEKWKLRLSVGQSESLYHPFHNFAVVYLQLSVSGISVRLSDEAPKAISGSSWMCCENNIIQRLHLHAGKSSQEVILAFSQEKD